jgi:hypothetical protein
MNRMVWSVSLYRYPPGSRFFDREGKVEVCAADAREAQGIIQAAANVIENETGTMLQIARVEFLGWRKAVSPIEIKTIFDRSTPAPA